MLIECEPPTLIDRDLIELMRQPVAYGCGVTLRNHFGSVKCPYFLKFVAGVRHIGSMTLVPLWCYPLQGARLVSTFAVIASEAKQSSITSDEAAGSLHHGKSQERRALYGSDIALGPAGLATSAIRHSRIYVAIRLQDSGLVRTA